MIEIRYLEQEEKKDTIPLWNEAFPEDKPPFLEYYYTEKTKDNRILAAWEWEDETEPGEWQEEKKQQGAGKEKRKPRLVSMLHRNPYRLQVGKRTADSDYIVAVATAGDRRHRGLMRRLLTRMMEDMHREGMAFCYLMPADRRIYEPFGFAYMYDQEHWKLKQEAEEILIPERVTSGQEAAAGRWMNRWLEERYQIFAVRDEAYIKRLLLELESEQGWMEFLYGKNEESGIAGIRCWWGAKKREQRMLLCEGAYRETEKELSPAIMARITDLKNCLEMLCLKADSPADEMRVILTVQDKLCPWNHGTFLWELNKEESHLRRPEEEDGGYSGKGQTDKHAADAYKLTMDIASLTQWIFGYRDLAVENWQRQISVWDGVFLDEIV